MRKLSCSLHQKAAQRGEEGRKCIWNNKTPRQINSTVFPWQRSAVIWRLVSHGCVSLPHRPPLCLTDGSCDCNHPSYCQRQKRARKGKSHTPSLSRSLVSSKQATLLWAEAAHGPQALSIGLHRSVCVFICLCAHACMMYRENMCGCASLAVCACPLYCMISHWSVHGGAVDMSDLAADQKHQRLVPLWPCKRGLISTCLCSVDRKNKRRERQTEEGRAAGERQKQAGIAQMKGCIERPEWNIWQWYITALIFPFRWANWTAKASLAFVCNVIVCVIPLCKPGSASYWKSYNLKKI